MQERSSLIGNQIHRNHVSFQCDFKDSGVHSALVKSFGLESGFAFELYHRLAT